MTRITTPFGAESTAADVARGIDLTGRRIDRHRRCVRHRRRDGARARRRRRRRHARRAQHRRGRADRRDITATTGNAEVDVAPPRSRRPAVDRRVRGRLERPAARARQQRRHDGLPGPSDARGLGAAVRDQPPRPLGARARPPRRPRRRRRTRASSSVSSPRTAVAGRVRGHPLRAPRVRAVARPTASRRPPTCCSPSRRPGAGRATASRPTRSCRARSAPTCSATWTTRATWSGWAEAGAYRSLEDASSRAPRRRVLAGDVAAARGHRRALLRGLQRGAGRRPTSDADPPPGVASYALDPEAAKRLWDVSLSMLETPVAAAR